MALLDVQVACLANQAMNYLATGNAPKRLGNAHPNIVPYQDFPTADGDFILTVGNDGQFRKFAEVAGQPQWADDSRFASNKQRVANRAVLIPLIRQATVFKTTAEWVAQLEQAGVPCGPINDLAQVFADPQVKSRGLAIELPHALAGKVPQVASPIRLSETPVEYRRAPPLLGSTPLKCCSECWDWTLMRSRPLRRPGCFELFFYIEEQVVFRLCASY